MVEEQNDGIRRDNTEFTYKCDFWRMFPPKQSDSPFQLGICDILERPV